MQYDIAWKARVYTHCDMTFQSVYVQKIGLLIRVFEERGPQDASSLCLMPSVIVSFLGLFFVQILILAENFSFSRWAL